MPIYVYKVRDKSGKVLQGQMEASDDRDLRKKLDEQNYFILDYSEKKSKKDLLHIEVIPARVKMIDISIFSWQLFTMLDAGVTLVKSLKMISGQTKNPKLKAAINQACTRVEEGSTFSDALKEHSGIFSKFYVEMINAGEVGGVLDEMLKRLAVYYEQQAEIRTKLTSAMIYPALLLTASIGVIAFLVTVVLPQFAVIFRDIGAEIPPQTMLLLTISVIAKKYWMLAIAAIAAMIILMRIYIATDTGRYEFDLLKIRFPLTGDLIKKSITCQFTSTLATLVSGGIPILTALDVVQETVGNSVVSKVIKNVSVSVGEGKPIAEPLEASKLFPDMVTGMIKVGEETGSLEKMLDKISEFYNKEVNAAIETFTKLIEPVLMVGMSLIIGFIAIAIFLPLANLMQSLRG